MSLTRKMLKAMGIEDEKIEQIIEAHTETTDALKKERDDAKAESEKNATAAEELEKLKANPGDDFEAKYNSAVKDLEDYKAKVAQDAAKREAEDLLKAHLVKMGIKDDFAARIVSHTDVSKFEVENGAFKDGDTVTNAVKEEWGDLVPITRTQGASVQTPPASGDSPKLEDMTTEQYMEYKAKKRG